MTLWLIQCFIEQGVLLLLVSVFLFTLYWLSLGKERAIQHKLVQEADVELKSLEAEPLVPFLADWLRLRRANWLDAMQRHAEAQTLYDEIKLKKPAVLARQFKDHPFPEGPHDVLPNLWPLPVVPE